MSTKLLTPYEVDQALRYSRGRSLRLARRNVLPHVTLPDGEIRFRPADIERLMAGEQTERAQQAQEVSHV